MPPHAMFRVDQRLTSRIASCTSHPFLQLGRSVHVARSSAEVAKVVCDLRIASC